VQKVVGKLSWIAALEYDEEDVVGVDDDGKNDGDLADSALIL
jgi:hypothetical protein